MGRRGGVLKGYGARYEEGRRRARGAFRFRLVDAGIGGGVRFGGPFGN